MSLSEWRGTSRTRDFFSKNSETILARPKEVSFSRYYLRIFHRTCPFAPIFHIIWSKSLSQKGIYLNAPTICKTWLCPVRLPARTPLEEPLRREKRNAVHQEPIEATNGQTCLEICSQKDRLPVLFSETKDSQYSNIILRSWHCFCTYLVRSPCQFSEKNEKGSQSTIFVKKMDEQRRNDFSDHICRHVFPPKCVLCPLI